MIRITILALLLFLMIGFLFYVRCYVKTEIRQECSAEVCWELCKNEKEADYFDGKFVSFNNKYTTTCECFGIFEETNEIWSRHRDFLKKHFKKCEE